MESACKEPTNTARWLVVFPFSRTRNNGFVIAASPFEHNAAHTESHLRKVNDAAAPTASFDRSENFPREEARWWAELWRTE